MVEDEVEAVVYISVAVPSVEDDESTSGVLLSCDDVMFESVSGCETKSVIDWVSVPYAATADEVKSAVMLFDPDPVLEYEGVFEPVCSSAVKV